MTDYLASFESIENNECNWISERIIVIATRSLINSMDENLLRIGILKMLLSSITS